MKGDKLGRQGGSSSQERNHEGRQAEQTSGSGSQKRNQEGRQAERAADKRNHEGRQGKAAAAAKAKSREIMKGDKLGRQGGSGSQKQFFFDFSSSPMVSVPWGLRVFTRRSMPRAAVQGSSLKLKNSCRSNCMKLITQVSQPFA